MNWIIPVASHMVWLNRCHTATAFMNWIIRVKAQLLYAREWRHQPGPAIGLKIHKPHVGVRLHERYPFACAVDDQFPILHLAEPSGERVVVHQRI
jgi:hypothetical protein